MSEPHPRVEAPFGPNRPLRIAEQGAFFVGGTYCEDANTMSGQMYVQYQVPADRQHATPLVMVPGGGQTGVGFMTTPDGRPGWADYFLSRGWAVYVVDIPGRGRAQGHVSSPGATRRADAVARRVSATRSIERWPQAHLHTQWPSGFEPGEAAFDQFYASQVASPANPRALEAEVRVAGSELIDKIGPVVLLTHSQGAPLGWQIADERPGDIVAIVAVEPTGPAGHDLILDAGGFSDGALSRPWGITYGPLTYTPELSPTDEIRFAHVPADPDRPDLAGHWLQEEPARRLTQLAGLRIALVTAEASYHACYDHGTSAYLSQAGVEHNFLRLHEHGIFGNGHMMMLERNNLEVAAFIERWLMGDVVPSVER